MFVYLAVIVNVIAYYDYITNVIDYDYIAFESNDYDYLRSYNQLQSITITDSDTIPGWHDK